MESPRLSQDICRVLGAFGTHSSWSLLNHPSCRLLSSYNCSLSYSKVTQTPPLECPSKWLTKRIYEGNRCCCRSKLKLNISISVELQAPTPYVLPPNTPDSQSPHSNKLCNSVPHCQLSPRSSVTCSNTN